MTFITATAMPLFIALAEIGLRDRKMLPSMPRPWSAPECCPSWSSRPPP
jgi:hypothetical protein